MLQRYAIGSSLLRRRAEELVSRRCRLGIGESDPQRSSEKFEMHDVVRELRQPALRLQHVLLELTKPAIVETVARQILVRAVAERDQSAPVVRSFSRRMRPACLACTYLRRRGSHGQHFSRCGALRQSWLTSAALEDAREFVLNDEVVLAGPRFAPAKCMKASLLTPAM
jgi:hypothetical protein